MKTFPAALQAHLDTGATTLCYCWRVTRTDGTVQGFTDHDVDVTFLSTTFLGATGFTASQFQQSSGMSVDNIDVEGALSSSTLNEDDLASGRYDAAAIELYWVNWVDPTVRVLLLTGYVGEVKRSGLLFTSELRSLTSQLNQRLGRLYQRSCDTYVGSPACGIDLTNPLYKGTGSVTAALNSRTLTASGLGSFVNTWFSGGVLTWTSGPDTGVKHDVKTHTLDSGVVTIELWLPPPHTLTAAWNFTITVGCAQDAETCRVKFNNILNFQGFPFMPGNDVVTAYPSQGGTNQGGGSLG